MSKPCIFLEVDWEENLKKQHEMPRQFKPGTEDHTRIKLMRAELNQKIKTIRKMVASGEAAYK